jgi:hypothetical protein
MIRNNSLALAVIAVALAEALAIALILIVPEKRAYWLIAGLVMPILWAGAELMRRDKQSLRLAIAYAATMLFLVEGFAVARYTGAITADNESMALRWFGILCGLVIVVSANMVPKKAGCVDPASPDAARLQKLRRYTAWVMVLAGVANTAIWAFAPIKQAALWSMVPLAAGLGLIALRIMASRSARETRA